MRRNVAIVGAGIGAEHAHAYQLCSSRWRIATMCDLDASRGEALAQANNAAFTSRFEAVLNDPEIDVVDICTPPHAHFEMMCQALAAGKHVICEKPLGTSLAQIDHLKELSLVQKTDVFPVFQYRYGPGMTQMRALLKTGLCGNCSAASLETHWCRDKVYYEAAPWRGTWAGEQGGAMVSHAIHIHDLLTCLLGPVASVYARLDTRVNAIETEDCAALPIKMNPVLL